MRLEQELFGVEFQNPVMLAAGTCGFGQELTDVVDLDRLGGLVTKSVTLEPRAGNPAPRVGELDDAMLNSIGLANPGLNRVKIEKLPWLASHVTRGHVFLSVAGHTVEEYFRLVESLEGEPGFLGFELNLSCPNDTRLDGLPFALDLDILATVVSGARDRTGRPLLVKLAPNVPDIGEAATAAQAAGADGITLVNTMPGLVIDPRTRKPSLGAGAGGLSGPALRAIAVHAVWKASQRVSIPLIGVGGVRNHEDLVQYLLAGARLVQIGTSTFADPGTAERVVDGLREFGREYGIASVAELIGAMEVPAKDLDALPLRPIGRPG